MATERLTATELVARRAEALQELALDLAVAREPADVCRVAVIHAIRALQAAGAAGWFLDSAEGTRLGAAIGSFADRLPPTPDLAAYARATRDEPHRARPWATPEFTASLRVDASDRVRTATLTTAGRVVGALALAGPAGAGGGDDVGLFGTVVRTVGEALGRAEAMADLLRLAAIVNASDDAMIQTDLDGTIVTWNTGAECLLGYPAGEVVGRRLGELIAPTAPVDEFAAARERILAGDGPQHAFVRHRHRDGTVVPMSMTLCPVRDDAGEPTGIAVIGRDLTGSLAAEERIRRLAAAVDSAPVAVVFAEPDGTIVEGNRGAEAMFQRTREELVGRPLGELADPPERFTELLDRVCQGETVDSIPIEREHPDGSPLRIQLGAFPVRDADGAVTAGVLIGLDVTEASAIADARRGARSLEALGRLAGGVAHDINNILAIIDGSIGVALESIGEGPAREAVDEIAVASSRAGRLVRQLLAFSRRRPVEPEPVDFAAALRDLSPMLRSLIGPAIEFVVEPACGLPPVRADLAGLEQIVVNLVLNARDAMPAGGRLEVRLTAEGDELVLTVNDTGEGIPEGVAKRIFEPFFTTKTAGPDRGSGLGLAAVHGAVTQAGGTITVSSVPGQGAHFTVRLPADREPDPTGRPELDGARPAAVAGGEHILLCEDEPALLRITTRMLERAGYRVTAHVDPREAARVPTDDIDLLLTDVQMPHLSGPELARLMPASIPVVLLSGYAPAQLERGRLLDKPFTQETLIAAVRAALDANM